MDDEQIVQKSTKGIRFNSFYSNDLEDLEHKITSDIT